jgi:hypothetical protein
MERFIQPDRYNVGKKAAFWNAIDSENPLAWRLHPCRFGNDTTPPERANPFWQIHGPHGR